jgi:LEA14-like dessication related protein
MSARILARPLALSTALSLAALGCASAPKVAATRAGLSVEVDRVMPVPQSLDATEIEVLLVVANRDDRAVKIDAIDYAIDTAGVAGVLKGKVDGGTTIEAQQKSELRFRQRVSFPKDGEAMKALIERGTVPVALTGTVRAGGQTIPFERNAEIATPTLPRFIVNDAQAARYGKDGVDLTMYLRLVNDNVFPVTVQGVEYTVYLQGKEIKSEQAAVGARILAASAEEYEVSKTLDGKQKDFTPAEVRAILERGELRYKVVAKVELPSMTLPFEYEDTIKLATGE